LSGQGSDGAKAEVAALLWIESFRQANAIVLDIDRDDQPSSRQRTQIRPLMPVGWAYFIALVTSSQTMSPTANA